MHPDGFSVELNFSPRFYLGFINALKQPALCPLTRLKKKEYKMEKLFYRIVAVGRSQNYFRS